MLVRVVVTRAEVDVVAEVEELALEDVDAAAVLDELVLVDMVEDE